MWRGVDLPHCTLNICKLKALLTVWEQLYNQCYIINHIISVFILWTFPSFLNLCRWTAPVSPVAAPRTAAATLLVVSSSTLSGCGHTTYTHSWSWSWRGDWGQACSRGRFWRGRTRTRTSRRKSLGPPTGAEALWMPRCCHLEAVQPRAPLLSLPPLLFCLAQSRPPRERAAAAATWRTPPAIPSWARTRMVSPALCCVPLNRT